MKPAEQTMHEQFEKMRERAELAELHLHNAENSLAQAVIRNEVYRDQLDRMADLIVRMAGKTEGD